MPRKKDIQVVKSLPKAFVSLHAQIQIPLGGGENATLKVGVNNVFDEEITAYLMEDPTMLMLIDVGHVQVKDHYIDGLENSLGMEVTDTTIGDELPINDLDLDSPKLRSELREGDKAPEVKKQIKQRAKKAATKTNKTANDIDTI